MCKNATATAANLLKAIEPTIQSILTITGQANTPAGLAAIAAYNSALTALENWQSGDAAQEVLELLAALQSALNAVFTAIPISPELQALINVILAGVETVIGVIAANSPAPAAPVTEGTVTPEVTAAAQTFHAHATAAETEAKVAALTGIKASFWDKARAAAGDTNVAADRYKSEWNKAVDAAPGLGAQKVA